ncbi:hypothetical protein OIDMADRAFT_19814 [Oidiodendron maius Zn]|uniref:NADPH-dependent FMN reductase-like domain-containing protein n=1 Tax=Oidiodendron maius (strain Zn) TaxID=913774 RepID=A0A0C3GUY1_OIDMZ|nr:hypothetical protein OIDMADRAFT_19814 [Oidiodendron maius Zn]
MPADTTATFTVPKSTGIIISTTCPNRIGPQVADWVKTVLECAKPSLAKNIKLSMVDIRAFNLPLFDKPCNPATVSDFYLYKGAHSRMWNEEITRHDGYILVLGEYHGGDAW